MSSKLAKQTVHQARVVNIGVVRPVTAGQLDVGELSTEVRAWLDGLDGAPLTHVEFWRHGETHAIKLWRFTTGENAALLWDGEPVDADELLAEMVNRARRDANAWRGETQVYHFRAFFGRDAEHPAETFTFALAGSYNAPERSARSFPSTPEGNNALLATMAHQAHDALLRGHSITTDTQGAIIADLRAEVARLQKQEMETLQLYRDLLTLDHDQKRQMAQDATDRERWAQFWGFLKVILPSAVNKLTGAKLLPETTSPMLEQFRLLFDSMSPEQVEQISGVFKLDQAIAFGDIFDRFLDDKDRQGLINKLITFAKQAKAAQLPAAETTTTTPPATTA